MSTQCWYQTPAIPAACHKLDHTADRVKILLLTLNYRTRKSVVEGCLAHDPLGDAGHTAASSLGGYGPRWVQPNVASGAE
jgi:hypothetical protein